MLKPFDFVILGTGLVGKQIAIKLVKKYPNSRIAIVDRHPFSYGASTRNAGFSCFGSVSEIIMDLKNDQSENVFELVKQRFLGIEKLVDEFGASNFDFFQTGGFEVFENEVEYNVAIENLSFINDYLSQKLNVSEMFKIESINRFNFNYLDKAIYNPFEGMLNPGKLNQLLSHKVHKAGVEPLYGLEIKEIIKQEGQYALIASNGLKIIANQLILANNAFVSKLLPELDVVPARGQIILTKPIDKLHFDGIFHANKGYIYFRNVGDRVLIGGGRDQFLNQEKSYDIETTDDVINYLINYLKTHVLQIQEFEVETSWSGIMAMGNEKTPIVKRFDESLVLCVRMGGMGVALGPIVSDEVITLL
ncbi:NAD(P)/FAD-dependent oxidoreductase [Marinobacter sp.]|uniref:NAD(P)/FAD-dependent oxidoreductase n=1 Tax=Marinobacter sp. TaxID=50741 RepID=UPI00349FF075